jgi:hypothetical protein
MKRLALMLFALGCGTGGDPGDGSQNLPNPGFAPYTVYLGPDDRAVNLFPDRPNLGAPFARIEGDRVALYLHECPAEAPCRIVRADSKDGINFDEPDTFAEHPDGLMDPFVSDSAGQTTLWAVTADGTQVVRQTGQSGPFTEVLRAPQETVFASPSVRIIQGVVHLFLIEVFDDRRIVTHQLVGGDEKTTLQGLCGFAGCRGVEQLQDVEVRYAVTPAGRRIWRALLSGQDLDGNGVLNFAASNDGHEWSPFAFNPAITSGGSLRSGTQIVFDERYHVYAVSGRSATRIVLAVNDRPGGSQRW